MTRHSRGRRGMRESALFSLEEAARAADEAAAREAAQVQADSRLSGAASLSARVAARVSSVEVPDAGAALGRRESSRRESTLAGGGSSRFSGTPGGSHARRISSFHHHGTVVPLVTPQDRRALFLTGDSAPDKLEETAARVTRQIRTLDRRLQRGSRDAARSTRAAVPELPALTARFASPRATTSGSMGTGLGYGVPGTAPLSIDRAARERTRKFVHSNAGQLRINLRSRLEPNIPTVVDSMVQRWGIDMKDAGKASRGGAGLGSLAKQRCADLVKRSIERRISVEVHRRKLAGWDEGAVKAKYRQECLREERDRIRTEIVEAAAPDSGLSGTLRSTWRWSTSSRASPRGSRRRRGRACAAARCSAASSRAPTAPSPRTAAWSPASASGRGASRSSAETRWSCRASPPPRGRRPPPTRGRARRANAARRLRLSRRAS